MQWRARWRAAAESARARKKAGAPACYTRGLLRKIPQYWNRNGALDGLAVFGCGKHALPFDAVQASLIQARETGAGLERRRDDPAVRGHGHLHHTSSHFI